MSNVVYFLPNVDADQVDLSNLAGRGLAHAFDRQPFCVPVREGPNGGAGLVVADPGRCAPDAIGFYSARQEWLRLTAMTSEVWIGHDRGPWCADEFARPKQRPGVVVELRVGTRWLVPIARSYDMDAARPTYIVRLPRLLTSDAAGTVTPGDVVPEWYHLWDLACRWHDARARSFFGRVADDEAGEVQIPLTDQEIYAGTARVLEANYYLSKPEVITLGFCDDETVIRPLDALADWPKFVEWYQKKTQELAAASAQRANTSGTPGPGGFSQATGQP